MKGGMSHIKSFDTEPAEDQEMKRNEVDPTDEAALPVDEDPLQPLALHVLQIDLDLAKHEVVWLGVAVANRQQLLKAGRVQRLENSEQILFDSCKKSWRELLEILEARIHLCNSPDLGRTPPGTL